MLLTAPDSVKIFIMFLLLQSLVCALGVSFSGSGVGLWLLRNGVQTKLKGASFRKRP